MARLTEFHQQHVAIVIVVVLSFIVTGNYISRVCLNKVAFPPYPTDLIHASPPRLTHIRDPPFSASPPPFLHSPSPPHTLSTPSCSLQTCISPIPHLRLCGLILSPPSDRLPHDPSAHRCLFPSTTNNSWFQCGSHQLDSFAPGAVSTALPSPGILV
jgi:hypothetical protein